MPERGLERFWGYRRRAEVGKHDVLSHTPIVLHKSRHVQSREYALRERDRLGDMGELVSQLGLIEQQPLAERAEAYAQLAEQLRAQLEQSDGE